MLLDHTLPLVVGQQKLSEALREQTVYEVEFRHGSLEIVGNIVVASAPLIAGITAANGGFQLAYQIAKVINAVVAFRRLWASLADRKQPMIKLSVNIDGVTQGANSAITVNPVVLLAADATKGSIDRLVSGIDGTQLERVSIARGNVQTVLTHADTNILGTEREELPTTVDMIGKLFEVNFQTRRGWLFTAGGRVPVTWEESIRNDIRELADRENVAFTVQQFLCIAERAKRSKSHTPASRRRLQLFRAMLESEHNNDEVEVTGEMFCEVLLHAMDADG